VTLGSWLTRSLRDWFGSGPRAGRIAEARLAVVDVDVTGTSIRHDTLTGIAALPVAGGMFRISDLGYWSASYEFDEPTAADSARRASYLALRDRVAGSPIVTYNPDFVRAMIMRSCRANGLPPFDGEWIDLAAAASVVGSEENELATMDYWLARMRSGGPRPHDATYDVFAMAQLLLAVIAYAEDAGIASIQALARSAERRAWLPRGGA
jgi:hypothetical protein